jgi:hypothetical protein
MYRVYFNHVFFVATDQTLGRVIEQIRGMGYKYRVARM